MLHLYVCLSESTDIGDSVQKISKKHVAILHVAIETILYSSKHVNRTLNILLTNQNQENNSVPNICYVLKSTSDCY